MKVVKSGAPTGAFVPFELTIFIESSNEENYFNNILSYAEEGIAKLKLEHTQELIQTIRDALDDKETPRKRTIEADGTVDTSGTGKYAIGVRESLRDKSHTTLEDWHENWHKDSKYI